MLALEKYWGKALDWQFILYSYILDDANSQRALAFVPILLTMIFLLHFLILNTDHFQHINVCLMVVPCDCVYGKGQHQLGQRERSFK